MDQAEIIKILNQNNSKLQGIAALGLSCTHYPLARTVIQSLFPGIAIVDPSRAVARHVLASLPQGVGKLTFLTTGDVLRLNEQVEYYLGRVVKSESLQL
jgi:glutamate racemase